MIRNGKKQPVAMNPVFGPFLIDAKILDARFDLDDPDGAVIGERCVIGAGSRIGRDARNADSVTMIDEPDMAAAAIRGVTWPRTASGTAMRL